jgi:hypothetical protein
VLQSNLETLGKPHIHWYFAFGLGIASELELPELAPLRVEPLAQAADIQIRLAAEAMPRTDFEEPEFTQAAPDDVCLNIKKVARYRIRQGREITIDPRPGAAERDVRLFLLGSALGVIYHQRGLLPIHANAILAGDGAVAIGGPSGIGKSTLAAHFEARGYPVLCDDVLVVSFAADGTPLAWPGIPRIKLWRQAAETFGYDCDALQPVAAGFDKYHLPVKSPAVGGPFVLSRLYILRDWEAGTSPAICRVTGPAAVRAVAANTYRANYLRAMGGVAANFAQAARLARHAEIYDLPRKRGLDLLAAETDILERHFRERPTRIAVDRVSSIAQA